MVANLGNDSALPGGKNSGAIKKILANPLQYAVIALGRILPDSVSADAFYLKVLYRVNMHKKLKLDNPATFNEKLQWLKLYDRRPEYTTMVDKYEAKKYAAERIGDQYIIPTLGVWDRFDDIDFEQLPDQFVLKTTHDSGGVVICNNRASFDTLKARYTIEHSLKRRYFLNTREWPYKDVKPRIIAEQYLVDESGYELKDYKLMCFDGEVRCSFVCSNRYSKTGLCVNFYDRNWEPMPFERKYPKNIKETPKPQCYDAMLAAAEKLSEGTRFLRVDFYECNGKMYFGELTFYPGSGMEEFRPEEWDYKLGEELRL